MSKPIKATNTQWHKLFTDTLEMTLTPVDIQVYGEIPVMNNPPKADVLLLRVKGRRWTKAQRTLLPDGIRDRHAGHVLIEFKYTESLNERVYQKAAGYDAFYKEAQKLTNDAVQSYIVLSKTPRKARLITNGYEQAKWPGVMVSERDVFRRMPLILLNELDPTPHNLAFKLFASRREQKETTATEILEKSLPDGLKNLAHFMKAYKEVDMAVAQYGAEEIMRLGRGLGKDYVRNLSLEDRLEGLSAEDRIKGMSQDELDQLRHILKVETP